MEQTECIKLKFEYNRYGKKKIIQAVVITRRKKDEYKTVNIFICSSCFGRKKIVFLFQNFKQFKSGNHDVDVECAEYHCWWWKE